MNHYLYIVRLFVVGQALFTVGQCGDHENDEEVFKFQVELIRNMWSAMDATVVRQSGWTLTKDKETLRRMAVGAAKFISFEFQDPSRALSDTRLTSQWGRPTYPDGSQDDKYINYLYFEAIPRDIFIRAAGPPNEYAYIIMVKGFHHSLDSIYGMSPGEYIFDIKIMETDPVQSKDDKNLLSMIEKVDLREVYQQMEFLDFMLVCLMAKDSASKQFPMLNLETTPSSIGFHLLQVNNDERGQVEEHVGYRCPVKPVLYIYFEDSKSVGGVVVKPGRQ